MDVITHVDTLVAPDGHKIFYRTWTPEHSAKAIIHIHHGMAEHSLRYHPIAHALCIAGYKVVAQDHRGHGKSVFDADNLGHLGDQEGWQNLLQDSTQLYQKIAAEQPSLPWILFGHSMGSFICLNLVERANTEPKPAALILSASAFTPYFKRLALNTLSKFERVRLGKRNKSLLIKKMTFEDFNQDCKPIRTEADWLSRDQKQVDRYLRDKLCGFECSTETWCQLSDALLRIFTPDALKQIPIDLPTLVLYGEQDSMGGLASNLKLIKKIKSAGVKDMEHRSYPGARHEILNELDADHVISDCIEWLDRKITG